MSDVHDEATRSRNMAAVRAADTKPELIVRRGLHALGFRFRLHNKQLVGKPDLVLHKYRVAIFVHGCFWHRHDCDLFKWPKTRQEFWKKKINSNYTRDQLVDYQLRECGWRVLHIWECALRGNGRLEPGKVVELAAAWISSDKTRGEITGNGNRAE